MPTHNTKYFSPHSSAPQPQTSGGSTQGNAAITQLRKREAATELQRHTALKRARDGVSPTPFPDASSVPEAVHLDEQPQQQLDAPQLTDCTAETSHPAGRITPPSPGCRLEALPAELRCHILFCISDLGDLRALVRASPIFYQQYLLDRRALLRLGLNDTLGSLLRDAYAVHWTASIRSPVDPRRCLEYYRTLREGPLCLDLACTEKDLMDMAAFHLSIARPLASECAARLLHNLDPSLSVGELTATESLRFLRALYRFQLYCNLFGRSVERPSAVSVGSTERLTTFFCLFKPWQIEEIHCIYVLLRDKYEAILHAVTWDLHRANPRFGLGDGLHPPPGSWDLQNSC